jgi:hypothetical protein
MGFFDILDVSRGFKVLVGCFAELEDLIYGAFSFV